jgi:hypothetical protein
MMMMMMTMTMTMKRRGSREISERDRLADDDR